MKNKKTQRKLLSGMNMVVYNFDSVSSETERLPCIFKMCMNVKLFLEIIPEWEIQYSIKWAFIFFIQNYNLLCFEAQYFINYFHVHLLWKWSMIVKFNNIITLAQWLWKYNRNIFIIHNVDKCLDGHSYHIFMLRYNMTIIFAKSRLI